MGSELGKVGGDPGGVQPRPIRNRSKVHMMATYPAGHACRGEKIIVIIWSETLALLYI